MRTNNMEKMKRKRARQREKEKKWIKIHVGILIVLSFMLVACFVMFIRTHRLWMILSLSPLLVVTGGVTHLLVERLKHHREAEEERRKDARKERKKREKARQEAWRKKKDRIRTYSASLDFLMSWSSTKAQRQSLMVRMLDGLPEQPYQFYVSYTVFATRSIFPRQWIHYPEDGHYCYGNGWNIRCWFKKAGFRDELGALRWVKAIEQRMLSQVAGEDIKPVDVKLREVKPD